jgi:hypothetical protein
MLSVTYELEARPIWTRDDATDIPRIGDKVLIPDLDGNGGETYYTVDSVLWKPLRKGGSTVTVKLRFKALSSDLDP